MKHGLARAVQSRGAALELEATLLELSTEVALAALDPPLLLPLETPGTDVPADVAEVLPAGREVDPTLVLDAALEPGAAPLLVGPPAVVELLPGPISVLLVAPRAELEPRLDTTTTKPLLEVAPPPPLLLFAPAPGRYRSPWQARPAGQVTLSPQVNRQIPPTQRWPWVHASLPQVSAGGVPQEASAAATARHPAPNTPQTVDRMPLR